MGQKNSQSGNALFLILIAVILFAALSIAMTMSIRGGGEDAGRENTRIATARIAQHSVDLERAVMRMRIGENRSDNEISFESSTLAGYANPSCTSDNCKVFRPAGGQASYIIPDSAWLDPARSAEAHYGSWFFTGTTCIPGIGLGSDSNCHIDDNNLEIVAYIPWITRALCIEINNGLEIPLDNGGPPKAAGAAWAAANAEYTGSFSNGEALIDTANSLYGKAEGCFEGSGTPPVGSYHYYRVLYPR